MRFRSFVGIATIALAAIAAPALPAYAQVNGSVHVSYKIPPSVNLTITPNFQSGFGPQGGAGSGSTPAVGGSASLKGGAVDFGTVVQGYNYLYKYAAEVSVATNDSTGFQLFAEGATDFDTTFPIQNALYWMISGTGNTPFTGAPAAHGFQKTAFPVTGSGSTTGINYTPSIPPGAALVWQYGGPTLSLAGGAAVQDYDFKLNVPASTNISTFSLYVVYTAVVQ